MEDLQQSFGEARQSLRDLNGKFDKLEASLAAMAAVSASPAARRMTPEEREEIAEAVAGAVAQGGGAKAVAKRTRDRSPAAAAIRPEIIDGIARGAVAMASSASSAESSDDEYDTSDGEEGLSEDEDSPSPRAGAGGPTLFELTNRQVPQRAAAAAAVAAAASAQSASPEVVSAATAASGRGGSPDDVASAAAAAGAMPRVVEAVREAAASPPKKPKGRRGCYSFGKKKDPKCDDQDHCQWVKGAGCKPKGANPGAAAAAAAAASTARKGNLNKDDQFIFSRNEFYKLVFEKDAYSIAYVVRDLKILLSNIERIKGVDREKATNIFWTMDLRRKPVRVRGKPSRNLGVANNNGELSPQKLEILLDFLPTDKKLRTQVCIALLKDVDQIAKVRVYRTPPYETLRRLVRLAANPKAVGEAILDLVASRVYEYRLRASHLGYASHPKKMEKEANGRYSEGSIRTLADPDFWSPTLCILADEYADDIAGTDIALVIEEGLQYSDTASLCEKVRGTAGQ